MRRLGKFLTPSLLTLALVPVVTGAAGASEQVYDKVLPGTVWVKAVIGPNKASFGSGALIDTNRRWVVTNNHVVDNQTHVRVFFPTRKEGEVVAEKMFYVVNEPKVSVSGRVVFRDGLHDIAIIELSELPPDARAVKLAEKSARPGQSLHVIGNPNGMALWVYSSGTVRSVYNKSWTAQTGDGKAMFLNARVVETQIPINPGDSGGPVVNDKCELVAIVSSYNKVQQLVSTCIDLTEVKKAVARAEKGDTGDNVAAGPQPMNPTPGMLPPLNPPALDPNFPESTGPLPLPPLQPRRFENAPAGPPAFLPFN